MLTLGHTFMPNAAPSFLDNFILYVHVEHQTKHTAVGYKTAYLSDMCHAHQAEGAVLSLWAFMWLASA